jgi:hypothetical protein
MRRTPRPVYVVLLIIGVLATCYAGWCCHRFSAGVMMGNPNWPCAWPYPDGSLLEFHNWLDARNPAPFKLEGEVYQVEMILFCTFVALASITVCGGLALAWPWLRYSNRTRGFEVVSKPNVHEE